MNADTFEIRPARDAYVEFLVKRIIDRTARLEQYYKDGNMEGIIRMTKLIREATGKILPYQYSDK